MAQEVLRDVLAGAEVSTNSLCPAYTPLLSVFGIVTSITLSVMGASIGTYRSSPALFQTGVLRPDRFMPNLIPAVLAQILAVYGLISGVIITGQLADSAPGISIFKGYLHLGAGLSTGLAGLASGLAIGVVGDAGVRGCTQQPRLYTGMLVVLIFSEVLGLYGMIVGLLLVTKAGDGMAC